MASFLPGLTGTILWVKSFKIWIIWVLSPGIYIYTQKSTFKTTKQAFLTLLYIADHNITSDLRPQDGYGILISGSAAATLEENVLETWPVI